MRPSKLHRIAIVIAAVALGGAVIITTDAVAAGGHAGRGVAVLSLAIASVAALASVDSSTVVTGVAGVTRSGTMTVTAITALPAIMDVYRSAVRSEGGTLHHSQNNDEKLPFYCSFKSAARFEDDTAAFRKGLNETGTVEGQNVTVEYHWLEGQHERPVSRLLPAMQF